VGHARDPDELDKQVQTYKDLVASRRTGARKNTIANPRRKTLKALEEAAQDLAPTSSDEVDA
jgi:hypothetical protein